MLTVTQHRYQTAHCIHASHKSNEQREVNSLYGPKCESMGRCRLPHPCSIPRPRMGPGPELHSSTGGPSYHQLLTGNHF